MALTYPLSRTNFMDILPIGEQSHNLPDSMELNRTGAGEQLAADLGDRLWQGKFTLGRLMRTEAGRPEVLIDLLRQAGRSFLVYDTRRSAPLLDPIGTILGASTPTIHTLSGDPRELRITGLPASYVLSPGDYLSFTYGSSPLRYALHRVVATTTAVAGLTPLFEVTPPIRSGAVTGAAVTLLKAHCKAVILAGSAEPGVGRRTITEGISFGYVQSLR